MPALDSTQKPVSLCVFAVCSSLALTAALAADFPMGTFVGTQTPLTVTFDGKGEFA